ncbi:hypothetical protein PPACK8108_LOCUS4446 [Phakopsora pachyrhizi]|uniref:Uncharacterized protein n=1 Tax=Phakopsora pachyrhizi TaxID=170000 RepID=A0AAV0AP33_PHAPC|nr:hypothetical protein PPACK8108_LOCUS4446 [Phakopsora pachyrhizi]
MRLLRSSSVMAYIMTLLIVELAFGMEVGSVLHEFKPVEASVDGIEKTGEMRPSVNLARPPSKEPTLPRSAPQRAFKAYGIRGIKYNTKVSYLKLSLWKQDTTDV